MGFSIGLEQSIKHFPSEADTSLLGNVVAEFIGIHVSSFCKAVATLIWSHTHVISIAVNVGLECRLHFLLERARISSVLRRIESSYLTYPCSKLGQPQNKKYKNGPFQTASIYMYMHIDIYMYMYGLQKNLALRY